MTSLRLAIIPLAILISACAATGPADDGFENSLESVDIGKLQDNDGLIDRVVQKVIKSPETTAPSTGQ